jgi:hypothetical protein
MKIIRKRLGAGLEEVIISSPFFRRKLRESAYSSILKSLQKIGGNMKYAVSFRKLRRNRVSANVLKYEGQDVKLITTRLSKRLGFEDGKLIFTLEPDGSKNEILEKLANAIHQEYGE